MGKGTNARRAARAAAAARVAAAASNAAHVAAEASNAAQNLVAEQENPYANADTVTFEIGPPFRRAVNATEEQTNMADDWWFRHQSVKDDVEDLKTQVLKYNADLATENTQLITYNAEIQKQNNQIVQENNRVLQKMAQVMDENEKLRKKNSQLLAKLEKRADRMSVFMENVTFIGESLEEEDRI